MREFDQDGPYMQEGYWGTHSLTDKCPYTIYAQQTPSKLPQSIGQMLAEIKPTLFAIAVMKEFQSLPRIDPVSLKVGETLVPEKYPFGTVVEVTEESLISARSWKPIIFSGHWWQRSSYLGVVARINYPKRNSSVLMRISDGSFYPYRSTLEVGEVVHARTDGTNWAVLQILSRVTALDIFAIGTGGRSV